MFGLSCRKWSLLSAFLFTPLLSSFHFLRRFYSNDLSPLSKQTDIAIFSAVPGSTSASASASWQELRQQKETKPTIDVVSIGSMDRPSYLKAQAETWAQHSSIRMFVNVTEQDDFDPNCSKNKTLEQVTQHVQQCRSLHSTTNFLLQYKFFPPRFVLRKANPPGWLCAQTRPGSGLAKIGRMYRNSNIPLPDFLFLIDDDTMVNVGKYIQAINKQSIPSDSAIVYAGCLTIERKRPFFRFSPYGGAGTFWSKESIQRLLEPIHCNSTDASKGSPPKSESRQQFVDNVCARIQENLILEKNLFKEGMYMFEFVEQVFQHSPNCFHSDWLVGHFVHFYHLSDRIWEDGVLNSSFLHPLDGAESTQYFYNNSLTGRYCDLHKDSCDENYTVCHYVTPEIMHDVTSRQQTLSLQ